MSTGLLVPAGGGARDGYDCVIDTATSPFRYAGLRTLTLEPGGELDLPTGGVETIVVPLQGAAVVTVGDTTLTLDGRRDVFAGASDTAYVPPGSAAVLTSAAGGRFALATAVTEDTSHPAARLAGGDVAVERRGSGQMSRLVRNFGTVDGLAAASVIACEVITPAGNWSSYPAHKHDEATEHEAELEEVYYFEMTAGPDGQPGLGFHRTSSSPGHEIDLLVEVHDRDVALVPFGWHGPTTAAPGHDMYYLNVMAGPAPGRRWLISDHPDQAWIRATWIDTPIDSRLTDSRYGG